MGDPRYWADGQSGGTAGGGLDIGDKVIGTDGREWVAVGGGGCKDPDRVTVVGVGGGAGQAPKPRKKKTAAQRKARALKQRRRRARKRVAAEMSAQDPTRKGESGE